MSLPELNLRKNRCTRFVVEYNFFLPEDCSGLALEEQFATKSKGIPKLLVVHNYGAKGRKCSAIYSSHQHKCRRDKKPGISFGFRLDYHNAAIETEKTESRKLDYVAFLRKMWPVSSDTSGRLVAYFEFPRNQFTSLINLPYSREDLALDKKVRICGLDLRIESEGKEYNQFIRVGKSDIYQQVGLLRLTEKPSQSFLRKKLVDTSGYARELLRASEEKSGEKSK